MATGIQYVAVGRDFGISMLVPLVLMICVCSFSSRTFGADLTEARQLYASGKYAECLDAATEAADMYRYSESWWRLKLQVQLRLGQYADAKNTLETALKTHRSSIYLRHMGYEVYSFNNDAEKAQSMFDEIDQLVQSWPSRYANSESSIIIGRMLLYSGADAREVLEKFYDRAKSMSARNVDVYLASSDVALEKHAYDIAAKDLQIAVKLDPENPEIHYRLSLAFASSDSEQSRASLRQALKLNPNHFESLLRMSELAIQGESFDEARRLLEQVLKLNPRHQIAWSYKSVIAHLEGDQKQETKCYENATAFWKNNPEVDHLIGKKLSQHYRFEVGAKFQRQALKKRNDYLPAKLQIAQDVLRLGEPGAWKLAEEANELDGYNVVMHNLMTLHGHLKKFETIQRDNIQVRMDAKEAKLYGDEVLDVLASAKKILGEKYEVEFDKPVVVEIFPDKADFAIRTFGLPAGDGYLGVCFGRVITANSPASRKDSPANWESVLWHEFCHSVTLEKTRNRMPRWLSEGISVYEERQKDAAWGARINPRFREMLLDEKLTPVSQLSNAFMSPPSGLHLQFAYLQSSLVIEYLVEEYGHEMLNRVLTDLGAGMSINESLQRYTDSIDALDKEFAFYAQQRARDFGKELDWTETELTAGSPLEEVEAWVKSHPDNYHGLRLLSLKLVNSGEFKRAQPHLKKLIKLLPQQEGAGNSYQLLATTQRELEQFDDEFDTLTTWVTHDSDGVVAYRRMLEICDQRENWTQMRVTAEKLLAVDPLDRLGHYYLSVASDKLGDEPVTLQSLQRLLIFNATDAAETHFRIAEIQFRQEKTAEAKRNVLMALEVAPRYREAHRLLLKIRASEFPKVQAVDQGDKK